MELVVNVNGRFRTLKRVLVLALVGCGVFLLCAVKCNGQEEQPLGGPITDAIKQVRELREANKQQVAEMSRLRESLSSLVNRLESSERERKTIFQQLQEAKQERLKERQERLAFREQLRNFTAAFSQNREEARAERKGLFDKLRDYREENGTLRDRIANSEGLIQGLAKRLFWAVVYLSGAIAIVIGLGSFVYIRFLK